ncbi:MAG TPA: hypothetical protein VFN10_02515, partial [Thermoanaerobaculia bacterium]|nr:hypothetical protein [Thermoanaerobaculia bacterium]
PAAAAPVAAAAPMAVESSPFAIDVEEDPFAHMAIVEPQEVHVEFDDPFATPATELHDVDAERQELQSMLANARAIVASLEDALARARENERAIAAKL